MKKCRSTQASTPLKQDVIGDVGNVLWVLMGSIGVVLLVACANVANLLLVRVEGRRQELAIRTALGAGRGRITCGLLFESLVLGFAGSVIGLAMAFGACALWSPQTHRPAPPQRNRHRWPGAALHPRHSRFLSASSLA